MKKLLAVIALLFITTFVAACSTGVEFTINFETNGGTVCSSIKTDGRSPATLPRNPTKHNYIFDGWFWDDGVWDEPFTFNSILDKPLSDTMTLTVFAKWTIVNKNRVTKPNLEEINFDYDGTAKTILLSLGENSAYGLSGDITKTNAGNYNAVVRLNNSAEYEWEDGTTQDLSLSWSISKVKIDKPVLIESNFVYDKKSKEIVPSVQNDALYTLNGDIIKTNAGNYTVRVVLNDKVNYEWADGTINNLSLDWSIAKAESTPSIPLGITAGFGQALGSVALPTGWAWTSHTDVVGDTGQRTHKATYTPTDASNYLTTNHLITIKVTHSILNMETVALNLIWDSVSTKHKIYFEIDGTFLYHDTICNTYNSLSTFNILDIPENATAMGIEQLNSQDVSQERAVFHIKIAEESLVSFKSIDSLNMLSWNSTASKHSIYFLEDENWVFANDYQQRISVLDIPTDASKMRIIPMAWSYDCLTNTLERPLPYDIPITTVAPPWIDAVKNLNIKDDRLDWSANSYYSNFRIYALIEGVWHFKEIVSHNGYTGNSIDLFRYCKENLEAIRIAPVGWNSTIHNLVNEDSEVFHLVRVAPSIVSVQKTSQEFVTNLRMNWGNLYWDSPSTYHSYYAKVDGTWKAAGTSSSGTTGCYITPGYFPTSYEGFRIVAAKTLFSFDEDTTTLQIISSLPTDITIEDSPQGVEVITDVYIEDLLLKWTSFHGGGVVLSFKTDGIWSEYGYNGYGYIKLSDVPQGTTDVRFVPENGSDVVYTSDETTNTLIRYFERLMTEFSFISVE